MLQSEADMDIRRHGRESYPEECCGALIGRDGSVVEAMRLQNLMGEEARRHFLVGPVDYQVAEKRAIEMGGKLMGFYHSHPDHPARPSQNDLEQAWPTFLYVILAVQNGKPGTMTSWRLREDRSAFEEQTVAVT
jgi:proteasome lid subunit RPN8/RPN11|tara:strand:- start:505 stop:906 length:402 start_codon:yes stop_codon:yes gene_type:complete